jgi:hypothetical protein
MSTTSPKTVWQKIKDGFAFFFGLVWGLFGEL